jgi:hypothetical protein
MTFCAWWEDPGFLIPQFPGEPVIYSPNHHFWHGAAILQSGETLEPAPEIM